ncbi:hypothetical protein JCM5296_004091 [Sporobolomyces johnsonii]
MPPQQDASYTSVLDYTLRTAPISVIYGTASFTALGALAGAASGVARNAPAIPAAFKTSINTGVFSFTFFSIRQYALTPLLTTLSLHPSPLVPSSSPPSPHTANLLPTTLSGLVAGTLFSYYQRPLPPLQHVRAGTTLALGCALVQVVVNELELARIRFIVWGEDRERARQLLSPPPTAAAPQSPPPAAAATAAEPPINYLSDWTKAPSPSHAHFSDPKTETFSERSDRLILSAWGWVKDKVGELSPVKRLDDGEYERTLEGLLVAKQAEREAVRKEREELERLQSEREARR